MVNEYANITIVIQDQNYYAAWVKKVGTLSGGHFGCGSLGGGQASSTRPTTKCGSGGEEEGAR